MKDIFIPFILLLIIVLAGGVQQNMAGEKRITKKNVPKPVLSAFEKAYPNATVKGYAKEVDKGKIEYEVGSREGGISRDISYDAEGNVLALEETIPASDAPEAVQDALKAQFSKAKTARCEKVTENGTTKYEFLLRSGKKLQEVVFEPDGKLVKKEAKKTQEKD